MSEEDWWQHDGTVDWAVNPGGQLVELGLGIDGWTVKVTSPFMRRGTTLLMSAGCHEHAFALFGALQDAKPPAARKALARWKAKRGRRDHPAKGDS